MQTIELYTEKTRSVPIIPLLSVAYRTEIILGNPKAKCVRMGICVVKEVGIFSSAVQPDNHTYAIMQREGDFLKINFLYPSMNELTYQKHFSENVFYIESEASFSLGGKAIFIPMGIYSCKQRKQYIELFVPILEK